MVNYVSKFSNNNTEYTLKDSNAVHKTGDEIIGGNKTFTGSVNIRKGFELYPFTTEEHGGYIDFHYAGSSADYTSRIIESSSGNLNINCTSVTSPTPATSDNSTKIATTAYINNKLQVVSELPANPDPNVFYYVVG